jgi:hypothetical protein
MNKKKSRSKIKNKKNSKSLQLNGGKPLFRSINEMNNPTSITIQHAFGLQPGTQGLFNAQNITGLTLIPTISYYGYFVKINLINNNSLININIANNPVHTAVNELGFKMCLVANQEIQYPCLGRVKGTTTVGDFRTECISQYDIFAASCRPGPNNGANSLTPGIVHAAILDRQNSLITLQWLQTTANRMAIVDQRLVQLLTQLLQIVSSHNTWRLGLVFMEFIRDSMCMDDAIMQVLPPPVDNNNRKLCLTNMHRWALMRTAHVSGIFHRDFHQGNALYSERNWPGFFHDQNANGLIRVNSVIQIIDWGRTFNNQTLFQTVRQLFHDMRLYIQDPINANQFTTDFITSNQIGRVNPNVLAFNQRIHNIFIQWRILGFCNHINWVISVAPYEQIDSHVIMYYENRYILGRSLVNANTYVSVVHAPDAGIRHTLTNLT